MINRDDKDSLRLLALHRLMDQVGGIDLHERASQIMEERGHEAPTDADYLDATREAMDVIVKEEFNL